MASKGVLVSDPSLRDMTPPRWAFEYAGLISNKERDYRTLTRTMKDFIVHFLGLDLIPPIENDDGSLSPAPVDYLPLTAFMDPRFFRSTMNKRVRLEEQEKALGKHPSTVDTMGYDEMLANFDEIVDDFDEIFKDAENKVYEGRLEAAVKAGILSQAPPSSSPNHPPGPSKPLKKAVVKIE